MPLPYAVSPDRYDEAFRLDGTPRPGYGQLIEEMSEAPRAAEKAVRRRLAVEEVEFGELETRTTFSIDPVPRLLTAGEWALLEAGLVQRMAALQQFIADVYGPRTLIDAGVMPARVIEESIYFEPLLAESPLPPPPAWVAGPDIVRDADGYFQVLEDNMRSPSGISFAIAGRKAIRCDDRGGDLPVRPLVGALGALLDTLRRADPTGTGSPSVAILSDGERSPAWYEHHEIAERLGLPLVTPADLRSRAGKLVASGARQNGAGQSGAHQIGARHLEIDVLYNRSSYESLRHDDGTLNELGVVLAEPLTAGNLNCVNAFGMGVADDKAVFPYVDAMIAHYLGEEPILRSVPTYDLGDPTTFAAQIDRLDELVVKPRWSFGGHGVVIGPEASRDDLNQVEVAVRSAPNQFVAQEQVNFSVHPTVVGDTLEPRRVDLRPFILNRDGTFKVIPGGLTRFAGQQGGSFVNSTQGGGTKDTWVLR